MAFFRIRRWFRSRVREQVRAPVPERVPVRGRPERAQVLPRVLCRVSRGRSHRYRPWEQVRQERALRPAPQSPVTA